MLRDEKNLNISFLPPAPISTESSGKLNLLIHKLHRFTFTKYSELNVQSKCDVSNHVGNQLQFHW